MQLNLNLKNCTLHYALWLFTFSGSKHTWFQLWRQLVVSKITVSPAFVFDSGQGDRRLVRLETRCTCRSGLRPIIDSTRTILEAIHCGRRNSGKASRKYVIVAVNTIVIYFFVHDIEVRYKWDTLNKLIYLEHQKCWSIITIISNTNEYLIYCMYLCLNSLIKA